MGDVRGDLQKKLRNAITKQKEKKLKETYFNTSGQHGIEDQNFLTKESLYVQ